MAEPKTVRGLTALHVATVLVKIFEPKGARLVSNFDGNGYARFRLGSATFTIGNAVSSARFQVSVQDRVQIASARIHLNVTSDEEFENVDLKDFIKTVATAIRAGMKAEGI